VVRSVVVVFRRLEEITGIQKVIEAVQDLAIGTTGAKAEVS
jgi:hypothetical protein